MKFTKFVKVGACIAIAASLVSAPYTIDLHPSYSSAEGLNTYKENLAFYTDTNIQFKLSDTTDESLQKAKNQFKEGKLQYKVSKDKGEIPKLEDVSSLAYSYNDVKNNPKLKSFLQEAIRKGEKVYIYGGLTFQEYSNLLGLEKISVDLSETYEPKLVHFNSNDDSLISEKGVKSNSVEDEKDIIGYTLAPNEPYSVFAADIQNYDQNGQVSLTTDLYLKEILDHESKVVTFKQNYITGEKIGYIKTTSASAAQYIRQSKTDIRSTANYLTNTAGRITTQYYLYQQTSESDSTYDYFSVKDQTLVQVYNGFRASSMNIQHRLTWGGDDSNGATGDEYHQSSPGDTSSSPYQVTLSAPWSLSFTSQVDTDPNIDRTTSTTYDYAKWAITDYNLADQDDYFLMTAWGSKGTYAGIDVTKSITFRSGIDVTSSTSQTINIRYDY